MVTTGMNRAFGAQLRDWLGRGTRNRFTAFLSGLLVTMTLQSSTATILMTAGFAATGYIATRGALSVMLGADVGTSLVAQILSVDIRWLSPVLMVVGFVFFKSSKLPSRQSMAKVLIGLGLMLLALQLLGSASAPMKSSEVVREVLEALSNEPLLCILIGAGLTALAHSSLGIVLLFATLAEAGAIAPLLGFKLVLGANLGGTVPPLLATSGLGPIAKRMPMANLFIRLCGISVLLVVLLVGPTADLIAAQMAKLSTDPARQMINFHTLFNVTLAAVFFCFIGPVANLMDRLYPAPKNENKAGRNLDPTVLDQPAVAIECAARETLRMADQCDLMLRRTMEVFVSNDARLMGDIEAMDEIVDKLHEEIKIYLTRIRLEGLDPDESARFNEIMSFCINLEAVGDIIDKNLMDLAKKKINSQIAFSAEGLAEIRGLHRSVLDSMALAMNVLISRDRKLAEKLITLKTHIRDMEQVASSNHIDRLRMGKVESIASSTLHLDFIRDLRRINSHLASIGFSVLHKRIEKNDGAAPLALPAPSAKPKKDRKVEKADKPKKDKKAEKGEKPRKKDRPRAAGLSPMQRDADALPEPDIEKA